MLSLKNEKQPIKEYGKLNSSLFKEKKHSFSFPHISHMAYVLIVSHYMNVPVS